MRKYETIIINDFLESKKVVTVKEEDYLKVVEEKERLVKVIESKDKTNYNLRKELKEKDEEIKIIVNQKEKWKNKLSHYSDCVKCLEKENKEKNDEIKRLTEKIICLELGIEEEIEEETYTLSYSYYCEKNKMIKQYKQSGLLKEEYEEMYGMDSDNWLSHSLVKDRKEVK